MKKIILCAAAAALVLNVTSCKKDDKKNDQKDLLIGVWKADYTAYDENHNGVIDEAEKKPSSSNETFEFTADGKLVVTEDGVAESGPYKRSGMNLQIGEGEETEDWTITTLETSKLVMTDIINEDGVSTIEEMGFKR